MRFSVRSILRSIAVVLCVVPVLWRVEESGRANRTMPTLGAKYAPKMGHPNVGWRFGVEDGARLSGGGVRLCCHH
jgi:hypothetical protein